jgi:hypothetical protein
MTAIVTSTYRYKRPPRKRKADPAAQAMPRIITPPKLKPEIIRRRRESREASEAAADASAPDPRQHRETR